MPEQQEQDYLDRTVDLVSSYVTNNHVRADELSNLIKAVHQTLHELDRPPAVEEPAPDLKPAVPIKKSITDDYIISLEDGRQFKSMKRYLARLGMTPDQYRAKWGLPRDYPMVAPGYAAKRSELAKVSGLGSSRRQAAATAAMPANDEPAAAPEQAPEPAKRRGRPKKVV